MGGITAETALAFIGEDDVSFAVDNEVLAFGWDVGEDAVAGGVVTAGLLVGALAVVGGVVEELTVEGVCVVAHGECLVVGHVEGLAPDGWGRVGSVAQSACDQSQKGDQNVNLSHSRSSRLLFFIYNIKCPLI